jgi:glycosyltransferase involved in cell wall biosynthesis
MCSALRTGGAERQWSILLPRLVQMGFTPRVLTLTGRGKFFDEIENAGIPTDCADMRSRYDLGRAWRALARVRETPDLVVTQEINAHFVGHAVAARAGVGHIAIDHRAHLLPRSLHRRMLTRAIARRVDCAVAVSRSQLPDLMRLGFPPSRIRVIYNGVPPLRATETAEATRASLGFRDDDFVALMVASMRPEKRVPFFIDAVLGANRTTSRIRGVIAGGGPEFAPICALAEQTNGIVRILGERSDVANLMQAADVVCLTSWTEGMPMALLEAMSLGCTILATDVPGVNDVIIHRETGMLSPPLDVIAFSDELCRLSRGANNARALGRAAKTRYERVFTAKRMTKEYAELFDSILSSHRIGFPMKGFRLRTCSRRPGPSL